MLTDAAMPRQTSTAITRAIGTTGLPPELTSVMTACGDGVEVGVPATPGCTSSGVAVTDGAVAVAGIVAAGDVASGRAVGRAVADCMAGACVGRAVGIDVGRGVADGEGGGVAAVLTTIVPCIAM
jgi:hypothetical protein